MSGIQELARGDNCWVETDGGISIHINDVCDRGYVGVEVSRVSAGRDENGEKKETYLFSIEIPKNV